MLKRRSTTSKKQKETKKGLLIPKWRTNPKAIEKFKFIHHFIPHPEKKERAKFLSLKFFGMYIFLIVFLMGLFRIIPYFVPGVLGYASNINISDLLDHTNKAREKNNLDDLVLNESLSKAAYKKALDMFANDYWAHVSPSGTEPWDFIVAENYDYTYAGENLAKNFSSSSDVVKAWIESPSHRENLLSRNYKEVGFAVVNGTLNGFETTLVVQMFGQPRDLSLVASKEESSKYLRQISTQGVSTVASKVTENNSKLAQPVKEVLENKQVKPLDVNVLLRNVGVLFLGFILGLFALDMYFSWKNNINKLTGHTFAHFLMLLMALVSIWFVLRPGHIL